MKYGDKNKKMAKGKGKKGGVYPGNEKSKMPPIKETKPGQMGAAPGTKVMSHPRKKRRKEY